MQGVCDERSVHGAGAGAGAAAGRQPRTRRESPRASTGLIDRGRMDRRHDSSDSLPCAFEPCVPQDIDGEEVPFGPVRVSVKQGMGRVMIMLQAESYFAQSAQNPFGTRA